MVPDQYVHFKACICHLFIFMPYPEPPQWDIWCGPIPSVVWRFVTMFLVLLGVGRLNLGKTSTCMLGVSLLLDLLGWYIDGGMSVYMSTLLLVCSDISVSVHPYVCQYGHLSIS